MQIPGSAKHCLVAVLLLAVTTLIVVTPASALEDTLKGVRITPIGLSFTSFSSFVSRVAWPS